ncbi:Gti1/Pac2 family-domain-containing protein [Flammula alnicola]|nr:Gti1/Pac2 family-domain-containing protein [Flammula alnicola]
MQQPTCIGLRVRTPADAHVLFHAVYEGILRMITRRLDTDERRAISSGCVYIWEERGPNAEATGMGIERWTDSIQWGPSRVRDEFLFYAEKRETQAEMDVTTSDSSDTTTQRRRGLYRQRLTKQTYSVFVETPRGRRKWHLIAYFVPDTVHLLHSIDDHPLLANLRVPRGMYTSARTSKNSRIHSSSQASLAYPDPRGTEARHSHHRFSCTRNNILPSSSLIHPLFPIPPHGAAILAPLEYLKRLPPARRHVVDEMALMSFSANIVPDGFHRSHM